MIIFWAIITLLLFFIILYLMILRHKALDIQKKRAKLQDMLWKRRNRIPLLLELLKRGGIKDAPTKEIIELRANLSSGALSIEEEILLEKKLSDLCALIFRKGRESQFLKREVLFCALDREFSEIREGLQSIEPDNFFRF